MELILTEDEKKADTWLELDNESVGKLVKAMMFNIQQNNENEGLSFWSAALLLCSVVARTNADTLKQTIEGLTIKGEKFGDWQITIKKLEAPTK